VQQNPFRLVQHPVSLLLHRVLDTMDWKGIPQAIAFAFLFDFFNGRVFSTEYDLTPASEARINWRRAVRLIFHGRQHEPRATQNI
jgi:hypothetical protein